MFEYINNRKVVCLSELRADKEIIDLRVNKSCTVVYAKSQEDMCWYKMSTNADNDNTWRSVSKYEDIPEFIDYDKALEYREPTETVNYWTEARDEEDYLDRHYVNDSIYDNYDYIQAFSL